MTAVTGWLDRILGRVTMYALVIICLVVLALLSLIFMFVGLLQLSPVGLLTNAAVLLIFSYLANGFAGLIFRTRPQLSSTAITALLLLFIFPPSLDLPSLGGVALAAVIAVLAKYLLAWRGRHIFNPAAIGAFVSVLTGLTFSAWWIGAPIMLPFVAVAGFLVLFRTRRFPLAIVFIVVATANIVIRYAVTGVPIGAAFGFALLSSPIVFFACFMLDEPLTLPPRRWQQLVEAVVVGVLFQLGFSIGTLSSTPELALVLGNLLAFFWGQRRGIRLAFVGRTQLTPTSWRFDFRPKAPVKFLPGQYMELSLPHAKTDARGWRRVFSIASAPDAAAPDGSGLVSFATRMPERSSSFKSALLALEPGQVISGTSVSGDFILPKDPAKPLLLVAAGIGITPYISQLEQLTASGQMGSSQKRDIVLLYSVLTADDIAFADVLTASGCRVVILSPNRPSELPKSWSWAGEGGALTSEEIHKAVPDAASRTTYLSGAPDLVTSLEKALHQDGVKWIVTDVFIGY
ncbi:MAG TPA: FAD-dependent oxidoreductase [Pseudolysinimonas sp.]|jgi:ferredoxin-NADP reductase